MTRIRQHWVKLPTAWIQSGGLTKFKWAKSVGSDNVAALMLLLVISHHVERERGFATMSYDEMSSWTGLSRAKVAAGIRCLRAHNLIKSVDDQRGRYRLVGYDETSGWAQVPARGLYVGERILAFSGFHLRRKAELDALKLYLLFAARRNNGSNVAIIGNAKIEEQAGITRNDIKTAQSLLAAAGLIHVEHIVSRLSEHGYSAGAEHREAGRSTFAIIRLKRQLDQLGTCRVVRLPFNIDARFEAIH